MIDRKEEVSGRSVEEQDVPVCDKPSAVDSHSEYSGKKPNCSVTMSLH